MTAGGCDVGGGVVLLCGGMGVVVVQCDSSKR